MIYDDKLKVCVCLKMGDNILMIRRDQETGSRSATSSSVREGAGGAARAPQTDHWGGGHQWPNCQELSEAGMRAPWSTSGACSYSCIPALADWPVESVLQVHAEQTRHSLEMPWRTFGLNDLVSQVWVWYVFLTLAENEAWSSLSS